MRNESAAADDDRQEQNESRRRNSPPGERAPCIHHRRTLADTSRSLARAHDAEAYVFMLPSAGESPVLPTASATWRDQNQRFQR